jgi:hypothetical protein
LAAWADGVAASNPAPASAATAASRATRILSRVPRDRLLDAVWPIVLPFLIMHCDRGTRAPTGTPCRAQSQPRA